MLQPPQALLRNLTFQEGLFWKLSMSESVRALVSYDQNLVWDIVLGTLALRKHFRDFELTRQLNAKKTLYHTDLVLHRGLMLHGDFTA